MNRQVGTFFAMNLTLLAQACSPISTGDTHALPDGEPPTSHVITSDSSARIDELVTEFIQNNELPGVSVGVIAQDKILHCAGYGWADLATSREMTGDTPILLSSISKTFVGVAAMQGVEEERFTLQTPLADLVGFPVDNPKVEGESITLEHMLTHNSGLRDSFEYSAAYADGDPTISLSAFSKGYVTPGGEYYRRANWSNDAPNDSFSYSNVGMAMAGLAIGRAYDTEFKAHVDAMILTPLGMEQSAYFLADLQQDPATPYKVRAFGGVKEYEQYGYPTYPDGMMRSSACDMSRFMLAISNKGELEGTRILEEASVNTLLEINEAWGTDEHGQAIAWASREMGGHRLFGHNGGDFGSATEMWIDRDDRVGVVVLLNSDPGSSDGWQALIDMEKELLDLARKIEATAATD